MYLKENLYDEAINCYTRAIELDPVNAIFPANRAMCLLKQEKFVYCGLRFSIISVIFESYNLHSLDMQLLNLIVHCQLIWIQNM